MKRIPEDTNHNEIPINDFSHIYATCGSQSVHMIDDRCVKPGHLLCSSPSHPTRVLGKGDRVWDW